MINFLKMFKRETPKERGYIRDYITGAPHEITEGELRRQYIERRLVLELGYPKELIGVDVDVLRDGKSLGKVDLIVFKDPTSKDPINNSYILILVKRGDLKDLRELLLQTSAEYGLLYDGVRYVVLRKFEGGVVEEVSRLPRYGEGFNEFDAPLSKDLLRPTYELSSCINDLCKYLRDVEGLKGRELFKEVVKLVSIKLSDELLEGGEVLAWVSNKEFNDLRRGVDIVGFRDRVSLLMRRARDKFLDIDEDLKINLKSVAEFFRRLHGISILKSSSYVKFESLNNMARDVMSVDKGEVLTPYPVAELIVKVVNPSTNELIIDPACGTGTLINLAVDYVRSKYKLGFDEISKYLRNNVLCVDINPEIAKLAKVYMALYLGQVGNVLVTNSLAPFDELESISRKYSIPEGLIPKEGRFDIVITHPPFNIKQRVTDPKILSQYELGRKWSYDRPTSRWVKKSDLLKEQFIEVLFLERCFQLLRNYGRMAIILPEEILASGPLGYVRQWIVENLRVLAVISLPHPTFIAYGFKARAFVLVGQKVPKEELEALVKKSYNILTVSMTKIGYDAFGKVAYKVDKEGNLITDDLGNPILDTDIPLVIEKFEEYKKSEGINF